MIDEEILFQEYLKDRDCPVCGEDHISIRLNTDRTNANTWWQFICNGCKSRWRTPKKKISRIKYR